ncbi:MAG: ethanolamine ammonia-lyase subunit EutC [Eubacteriales bacterium]|nr:ethanolamine ammonia-lyase subunit EutC [Eubacteriales bacterium]
MNKQDLAAMVAEILAGMGDEPMVKASDYRPTAPQPEAKPTACDGAFVPDVTALDLRRLYQVENPENGEKFRKMKERTPARLGSGRAGPRYQTLTMLRFRADHAAAQDAVFSQVPEDFAEKNGMTEVRTRCKDKDEYLTRPDHGRIFDEANSEKLRRLPKTRVQLVVGDGLSGAAIQANAMDCLAAIREGLKIRGIEAGDPVFVRYCRVGASDAIGELTGCELVCMLVGERPGLVTDKSMSAYITYGARRGIPEAARSVVSNIHAQGTPAVEAGAHIAGLIEKMLQKKASGIALQEALA